MTESVALVHILVPCVLVLIAAVWIVWVDLLAFEISFGGCAILLLSGLALTAASSAGSGMTAVHDGLVAGAIAVLLDFGRLV